MCGHLDFITPRVFSFNVCVMFLCIGVFVPTTAPVRPRVTMCLMLSKTFWFCDSVLYRRVLCRIHLHLQPLPAGLPAPLGQTVSEDLPPETQRLQPGHAHVSLWHPGHLGQECPGPQVRRAVALSLWLDLTDFSSWSSCRRPQYTF